jgi:hypothetical protein
MFCRSLYELQDYTLSGCILASDGHYVRGPSLIVNILHERTVSDFLWRYIHAKFRNIIFSTLLIQATHIGFCSFLSFFLSFLFLPAVPRSVVRCSYPLRSDTCQPNLAAAVSLAGRSVLARSLARGCTTCMLAAATRVPGLSCPTPPLVYPGALGTGWRTARSSSTRELVWRHPARILTSTSSTLYLRFVTRVRRVICGPGPSSTKQDF